jgi:hypothetical protein
MGSFGLDFYPTMNFIHGSNWLLASLFLVDRILIPSLSAYNAVTILRPLCGQFGSIRYYIALSLQDFIERAIQSSRHSWVKLKLRWLVMRLASDNRVRSKLQTIMHRVWVSAAVCVMSQLTVEKKVLQLQSTEIQSCGRTMPYIQRSKWDHIVIALTGPRYLLEAEVPNRNMLYGTRVLWNLGVPNRIIQLCPVQRMWSHRYARTCFVSQ